MHAVPAADTRAETPEGAREKLTRKITPRDATPLGDPRKWLRPDDYPSTAAIDESEGSVSFQLRIAPDGRVSECSVTISSGVDTLDDTACNLITVRAVFDPARDRKGKPIWGSYSSRVVWKMKEPDPAPVAMEVVSSYIVETDGSVSDCQITGTGITMEQRENGLRNCSRMMFAPYVDADGEPVRRRARSTLKLEVEPVD